MTTDSKPPVLARDAIFLGREKESMDQAIDFVGGELVKRGVVGEGYVESMKSREETVSTYLGNGVALPHGTFDARHEIKGTALIVAQYPGGIQWGDATAYLVFGLAALGDDHVQLLSHVAEVLQDEEQCRRLWTTKDIDVIYDTLVGSGGSGTGGAGQELSQQVTILNPAGLHARPAALIVEKAKGFQSDVRIVKNGKPASAKSVMSVLALGASTGDVVTLFASGPDAEQAIEAIVEIMVSTEGGP